jgi:hypothetical protein
LIGACVEVDPIMEPYRSPIGGGSMAIDEDAAVPAEYRDP